MREAGVKYISLTATKRYISWDVTGCDRALAWHAQRSIPKCWKVTKSLWNAWYKCKCLSLVLMALWPLCSSALYGLHLCFPGVWNGLAVSPPHPLTKGWLSPKETDLGPPRTPPAPVTARLGTGYPLLNRVMPNVVTQTRTGSFCRFLLPAKALAPTYLERWCPLLRGQN